MKVTTYLDVENNKVIKLEEPVYLVWDITEEQVENKDLIFNSENQKL